MSAPPVAPPDEELLEELRRTARDLLDKHCTSAEVRAGIDDPAALAASVWAHVGEAGWSGIEVPEEAGGAGMTVAEVMTVVTELGRALAPTDYLATAVLALPALAAAGRSDWLSRVAAGEARLAVALGDARGRLAAPGLLATRSGSGWLLSGACSFVPGAPTSDALVLVAHAATGPVVALAPRDQTGLAVTVQHTQDFTRSFGTVAAQDLLVPDAAVLAVGDAAARVVERTVARGALALAAECLGIIDRVVETTTAYLKQRHQFGRPIGSFQALKHRMADLVIAAETARVAVHDATERLALDPDDPAAARAVALAAAHVPDAAVATAAEGISLHGGIGYTWEHDMHLLLRRAIMNRALYGDSRWHRDRLVALLLAAS